jgi:hypothetical protein
MLFLGKLDGPKLRRETIIDCLLLPFLFFFWAAISFLLLLRQLLSATIFFTASFIKQAIQWPLYLAYVFLTTKFGQALWFVTSTVLCTVFIVPIVFYTFYKRVYDFGPKHRKRTFIDIITNPVPGIEFKGRLGESVTFDSFQRGRFNYNAVERKLQRNKMLSSKLTTKSTTSMVYDCPITKIKSVAPCLYGYATYPTMNNASFIENHIDDMPQKMSMTLYFAICHFSCPEKVFKMLVPHRPPDGFITEGLTVSIITAIYSIIIFQAWIRILNISWKHFLSWLILRELHNYRSRFRFFANPPKNPLKCLAAYTTSDSLGEDTMISFDTDLSFWVCNNAATGHICKDKSLFSGDLVPSIYEVSTANGIDFPSLMGTVILQF